MAAESTDHIYEDMNSPRKHKENDKALEIDDRSKSGRNQGEIVGIIKRERACSRPRSLLILALLTLSILIVSFGAVSVHIYLEYAELKNQIDKLSIEATMMQANKIFLKNELISVLTANLSEPEMDYRSDRQLISVLTTNLSELEMDYRSDRQLISVLTANMSELEINYRSDRGLISVLTGNLSELEMNYHFDRETNSRTLEEVVFNYTQYRNNIEFIQQTTQELLSLVTYTLSVVSFDSCRAVMQFPHLPCGVYNIRNFDGTHTQSFCKLNCSNPFQGWRRIAYLDMSSSHTSSCPEGFVSGNDPSACVRGSSSPGCSSVIYHNHNLTTYSKVIGHVYAIPYHSLDGFAKFGDDRPDFPTLDQNYVDGVSITHGTPRQHIWTVTFSANHIALNCSTCFRNKPSFVSNHYSCEELLLVNCSNDQCRNAGQRQCVANEEFFYRDLPHATSDDLEVRVCRDETRGNEDISISLLEVYVQ